MGSFDLCFLAFMVHLPHECHGNLTKVSLHAHQVVTASYLQSLLSDCISFRLQKLHRFRSGQPF